MGRGAFGELVSPSSGSTSSSVRQRRLASSQSHLDQLLPKKDLHKLFEDRQQACTIVSECAAERQGLQWHVGRLKAWGGCMHSCGWQVEAGAGLAGGQAGRGAPLWCTPMPACSMASMAVMKGRERSSSLRHCRGGRAEGAAQRGALSVCAWRTEGCLRDSVGRLMPAGIANRAIGRCTRLWARLRFRRFFLTSFLPGSQN